MMRWHQLETDRTDGKRRLPDLCCTLDDAADVCGSDGKPLTVFFDTDDASRAGLFSRDVDPDAAIRAERVASELSAAGSLVYDVRRRGRKLVQIPRMRKATPTDWFGAPTVAELQRRISRGWPDGAARAQELELPAIELRSVRRRLRARDAGDMLRPEAVLGTVSPDRAWTRPVRLSTRAPRILTIQCELTCPWWLPADALFWRGAAAMRAADACESAGIPHAIIATDFSDTHDVDETLWRRLSIVCTVKEPSAPLDPARLAAVLCMPGWKRHYLHRYRYAVMPSVSSKLGLCQPAFPHHLRAAGVDLSFPMPGSVVSQASAAQWLQDFAAFVAREE